MNTLSTVIYNPLSQCAANDGFVDTNISDFRPTKTKLTDNCVQDDSSLDSAASDNVANEIDITGSYLHDLFVDSGLSVPQIAEELGCSRQAIYDIFDKEHSKSKLIPKLLVLLTNNQVKINGLTDKMRRTRLKKKLTSKETARLIGCSEAEYKNMEDGTSRIENLYAVKMSEILGFEIQPDIVILTEKNRNDILMSRKENGLTQKELGEKVGYFQTAISAIETGVQSIMQYDTAVKLEQILGIKLL